MAVILTEEDIRNAKSYVPIETKQAMANWMTVFCVEEHKSPNDGKLLPLPPVYKENRMTRQLFMMGVLAHLYLGKPCEWQSVSFEATDGRVEKKLDLMMDADAYNEWAGSHVLNQMERMKKLKGETADKVFDILSDYKLFEQMLLGAIRDEVSVRNSEADRLAMILAVQNSEAEAAALKAAVAEAKTVDSPSSAPPGHLPPRGEGS